MSKYFLPFNVKPKEMNAKIYEIFKSIQGEGKYAGEEQVFVRFYGCHMHCDWCDVPDAIGDTKSQFKEYLVEELFLEIKKIAQGTKVISLTGGEPLLQSDFLQKLCPLLKKEGFTLYLETSGVLFEKLEKIIDFIDIIAMDLKLPSSTKQKEFWKEHQEFLAIARGKDVFIKTVISSDTDMSDIVKSVEFVRNIDSSLLFIFQPNSFQLNNGVMNVCLEAYKYGKAHLLNVRILPQMHKMMQIR